MTGSYLLQLLLMPGKVDESKRNGEAWHACDRPRHLALGAANDTPEDWGGSRSQAKRGAIEGQPESSR